MMKYLIGLQNRDTRIKEVRKKKAEGPARIEALEADLIRMESEAEAEAKQLEASMLQRKLIEQEIDEIEEKIEKSKVKLANIKSNKEYQAALKEIEDREAQKSAREDRVLEIMEEAEGLEKRAAEKKAQREAQRQAFEEEREKILQEVKALDRQLEGLEGEKSRLCEAIDQELLKKYNFIMKHKEGIAVSPVVQGVCQICHMGIPPQKFNELKRGDALMNCPHCSRIIYWGEDERLQSIVQEDQEGMLE
jgi:predicted  nucleic acid-binding Zn-ribbon protein